MKSSIQPRGSQRIFEGETRLENGKAATREGPQSLITLERKRV
jgi:hypothetical protein